MSGRDETDRLDRHGLVLACWLSTGSVALGLFHFGFGAGGPWWIAGGFVLLIAGFALHVVVNAVTRSWFNAGEVALGLVLYLSGLLAFVLATLLVDGFAERHFLPVAGGMAFLAAAAIFAMVTRFGPRAAFEQFDIIRDNNPRRASSLAHRGGRR